MWHKNSVPKLLLTTVVILIAAMPGVYANPLSTDAATAKYMSVKQDTVIYAQIGDSIIPAGEIKQGQLLPLVATAEYYAFRFGNGTGFIDKNHLVSTSGTEGINSGPSKPERTQPNQNIIIKHTANIHTAADPRSEVFAVLKENLRYPLTGKQKDRTNKTWYEIEIGNRPGYINGAYAEIDHGIPILTYHHILKNEENKYFRDTSTTTSDIAFSDQISWLRQAGYNSISLYQLEAWLNNEINLPGKVVVLTFDDGLKSVYRYAWPILKKYGFQATAFIISSRIKQHPQQWDPDSLQFMSIAELKQIQDVFDIQSHTHFVHQKDSQNNPIILSHSDHDLMSDFQRSRRTLSQFNPHAIYLAYPFGCYNQIAIDAAKNAGFNLAVTTIQGKVKAGDNRYTLKRLYLLQTDSIATVIDRIANTPWPVAATTIPVSTEH